MRYASVVTLLVLTCLGAGVAQAQWSSMDHQDGTIKFNYQGTFVYDEDQIDVELDDGTGATDTRYFLHNDIYFQGAYKGWGGYVDIPYTVLFSDLGVFNLLSNVEVGGLWDVAFPLLNVTLRVGVGLPTMENTTAVIQAVGTANWARMTDLALTEPDIVSTRIGGSIRLPAGILAARADVGVDLMIPIGEGTDASDFNTIFRFNLGAMLMWDGWGGTIEYNVATPVIANKIEFDPGGFPHALVVSIRHKTHYVDVYVSGTIPLAEGTIGGTGGVSIGVTTFWTKDDGEFVPTTEFLGQ